MNHRICIYTLYYRLDITFRNFADIFVVCFYSRDKNPTFLLSLRCLFNTSVTKCIIFSVFEVHILSLNAFLSDCLFLWCPAFKFIHFALIPMHHRKKTTLFESRFSIITLNQILSSTICTIIVHLR